MSNELAISTKQLTKTFNGKEVIRGCNISVEKGTIYGFIGKNGAGKTTIIKTLLGLLKPTTGEVKMCIRDRAFSYMPQDLEERLNVEYMEEAQNPDTDMYRIPLGTAKQLLLDGASVYRLLPGAVSYTHLFPARKVSPAFQV